MRALKGVLDAVWAEAAMLVAVLANTLIFAALTGPGWGKPTNTTESTKITSLGLWRVCLPEDKNGQGHCHGLGPYHLPGWFTATQALITTCMSGLLIAFSVMILFACIKRFKEDRRLLILYILVTFVFAILGIAGVVLFGEQIGELLIEGTRLRVGWSYIVAATGLGMHFLCITLVIIELIVGRRSLTSGPDTAPVVAGAANIGTSAPPTASTGTTGMETIA